jgi:uncharacterized protein DUF6717
MIDRAIVGLPNAEQGLTMMFSAEAFPGHQFRLEWRRTEGNGNWYYSPQLDVEGWLCSALFRYFSEPPKELFVQVRSLPAATAPQKTA